MMVMKSICFFFKYFTIPSGYAWIAILMLVSWGRAQEAHYQPGQGIRWQDADSTWRFQMMGYLQATAHGYLKTINSSPSNEFFVRRAVTDIVFTYLQRYRFFMELDARGENRYEMIIAQIDIQYADGHHMVAGKYMTPFSPENHRTSRALTTVERYSALNSLFKMPAMTSQYGLLLYGRWQPIDYYLGVCNGNGSAGKNIREDNYAKEWQTRLVWHIRPDLKAGAGFDYSRETNQPLGLYDHTFSVYSRDTVRGRRYGYLAEWEWTPESWLCRMEALYFIFPDPYRAEKRIQAFRGGYLEWGWFMTGHAARGFQWIGRYEHAEVLKPYGGFKGPKMVRSFLVGFNWHMNPLLRLQMNMIHDRFDRRIVNRESRYSGRRSGTMVLSMLQMMF